MLDEHLEEAEKDVFQIKNQKEKLKS